MYNNYLKILIAILIVVPLYLTSPKIFSQNVVRCGVQGLTLQQHQDLTNQYNQWLAKGNVINSQEVFYIPIAFHIIRYDNGDANVTDQQIMDQIEVLNASYSNTSFQFILHSIERINNTLWTNHSLGSPEEIQMKQTLAIEPLYILNFYTCAFSEGPLGYAWFPFSFPEDSYRHGVAIKYTTLPGGSSNGYNEGDTGTHEVGHYLGLFHTFELGCTVPGDEVDDTPYEESDAHGCPVGRNTCPSPGDDPIHNFMDYTYDSCMDHFTPGQANRMWTQVSQFRPSLIPISVTVDQKRKNGVRLSDTFIGQWNGNSFTDHSLITPLSLPFHIGRDETLRAYQNYVTNPYEKYNQWLDYSDVTNHKTFLVYQNMNQLVSQFDYIYQGIKIKNSLEGTGIDGGQIKIKDPWLIDYPDPLYGNTLRNQGMSAPFREQTSPFTPNYTSSYNGFVYKGLFLNQSGPVSNWQGAYYSVGSPAEQTISINNQNRKFYPFKWGGTGVTIQNEYLPETGIVFNTSNAVAVASLKGQLMSNSTNGISSNSQRKMVRTDNGIYHVVYESFGHIFYTHSLTSDFNGAWAPDQLVLDHAKNPAIEYHSNIVKIVAEYFDPQYSTNVDLYLLTFVQQSNGTYQNSESEIFATCPSAYFGSAKPVLAYNNGQIVVVYRKNATDGLKERSKWYYPGNGSWVWSSENTIPQTDANSINPAVAELYGHIHIVFESLNEIKYKFGYIMSTSWRYDPLLTLSTGSGFNINRNPSISISGAATNYVVVSWTGVYTAALDKKLPKQNDYIDRYAAVVKVGYGSSWGGTSNFSNNVGFTDNNSLNSSVGSIVAWSESNGQFSKYVKRRPNGLYDNIASLSTNGKFLLVSNGSQFNNIKAMVFNTLTSAPYMLNNCNNDFSQEFLSKENEQQQINLSYGRSGIIEKNSLEFLFSLGDVLLDDNVIKFIPRVDTLPVNNLQELNSSARTESFSLNNQSQLIFSNSYYVVNANKADSLLEDDFSVNFKCQLVNASTEQVVGTFDEMIYNKNNVLEYDNPGYLVDCSGIEAGEYYLRLFTSTNNNVNLFISDIQKENVVLEKSNLKVKNFKGEDIPLTYGLDQNYPNPFNPNTTIRYQLPQNGMVTLKVYDILGAEVATLVNEEKLAGKYEVNFNASTLASGVYIYKLQAGSFTNSKKMLLLK